MGTDGFIQLQEFEGLFGRQAYQHPIAERIDLIAVVVIDHPVN